MTRIVDDVATAKDLSVGGRGEAQYSDKLLDVLKRLLQHGASVGGGLARRGEIRCLDDRIHLPQRHHEYLRGVAMEKLDQAVETLPPHRYRC